MTEPIQLVECAVRRAQAVAEIDEHDDRDDGAQVVSSLADGLTQLRNLLFTRVHADVEIRFGTDSMLLPASLNEAEMRTKVEIEAYQIAESSDEARQSKYVIGDDDWYSAWLAHLRFGDATSESWLKNRLDRYATCDSDSRRLIFSNVLVRAFPEARHAPLVLFRLFPLAACIVTAIAFGDHFRAAELRKQQASILPVINDCQQCHGRPLDNGDQCSGCGNPLWTYRWLMVTD